MAAWTIGGLVELQTAGPKSVRLGNGLLLLAPHHLLLVPVSTPLPVVNHCCSGFLVSRGIEMSGPFNLLTFKALFALCLSLIHI